MKTKETVLVTGASGHLGKRVVELLLDADPGRKVIATTRAPEKLADLIRRGVEVRSADFDEPVSLARAFHGADRLLLISTDRIGSRVAQHENAIGAAVEAGVGHVVYTSVPDPERNPASVSPDHLATERAIRASGIGYTFLRNNLYADLLLSSLSNAIAMGSFFGAAGDGKVAYVSREDCARAAAAALASSETESRALNVTGPRAVTYAELAQLAGEIAGQSIPYVDMTSGELKTALMKSGLPDEWASVYASFDEAARGGFLGEVSDTVLRLTGRAPQDVRDFLLASRDALLGKR